MTKSIEKIKGFCGTVTKTVEISGYDSWGAHELYTCKLIGTWTVRFLPVTTKFFNHTAVIFVQPMHTDIYGNLMRRGFFPTAIQVDKNPDLTIFNEELLQYALNAFKRRTAASSPPSTYEFISRTDPRYSIKHPRGLGRPRG